MAVSPTARPAGAPRDGVGHRPQEHRGTPSAGGGTVIRLHPPPLPSVGFSMGMERGCQQLDSFSPTARHT